MLFHKFHFQLANKLLKNKEQRFSRPIIRISTIGIALGIIVMLFAVGITMGYKAEISKKVVELGAHIRISNYDFNYSYEQLPIDKEKVEKIDFEGITQIENVAYYCTKVGIIKTDCEVEGVVLKGVDSLFFKSGFVKNIIEGSKLQFSGENYKNQVFISKKIADKLQLSLGDKVHTYFVQDPPKFRNFTVVGIYRTNLPDYDESFIFVNIEQVQKLNEWTSNQIGGVDIFLSNFEQIDEVVNNLNQQLDYQLKAETIQQQFPQLFEWLALFDMNVIVLLTITFFVCIITILSTFFIIIIEQIQTIGIFKAIGMKNKDISTIFIIVAGKIILKSLLIGNAIALLLAFLQQKFHLITLDVDTYYVPYVPISLSLTAVVLLNLLVFILCIGALLIPGWFVASRISPVNAIRFE